MNLGKSLKNNSRWVRVITVCLLLVATFLLGSLVGGKFQSQHDGANALPDQTHNIKKRDVRVLSPQTQGAAAQNTADETEESENCTSEPGGSVYIRWGRTGCPADNSVIYKGVIAGGHSGHAGGGTQFVCLTENPNQEKFVAGNNGYAYVYGAEFKAHPSLFDATNMKGFTNHDGSCVACLSSRNAMVMIPGQKSCVQGWTIEYHGVLMGSKHTDKGGKNYICLDYASQADREGYRADGGADMWPVEAACGSLPCPPYEQGKELTCVVCTR